MSLVSAKSSQMIKRTVAKFGGTSMGDADCMLKSAQVTLDNAAYIAIVSATSGTTNQLIDVAQKAEKNWSKECEELIQQIRDRHLKIAENLHSGKDTLHFLNQLFEELQTMTRGILLLNECSLKAMDRLQSLGERMSSLLFVEALRAQIKKNNLSKKAHWVDTRKVILTNDDFGRAKPQTMKIAQRALQHFVWQDDVIYVGQGFIGETFDGYTTTLGRGGSDYSAALIGEAVNADVVQIWTDVSGIATTDPRICPKASVIPQISFQEASELATFGAKVLHPATLVPAMSKNIPVFVGNTFAPQEGGTWVLSEAEEKPLIRAIALRQNQTLVTLTTPAMLNTHGFLFRIFKVFNDHKASVDAITTSEISVSMTLDPGTMNNKSLFRDLESIAQMQVEEGLTLVAVIGNNINHTPGLASGIFECISDINVRMICMGASKHNFCFLVDKERGLESVKRLHKKFLE